MYNLESLGTDLKSKPQSRFNYATVKLGLQENVFCQKFAKLLSVVILISRLIRTESGVSSIEQATGLARFIGRSQINRVHKCVYGYLNWQNFL
jgi:hypothetical protein